MGRDREQKGSHSPRQEVRSEVSGGFSAWVDGICAERTYKKAYSWR